MNESSVLSHTFFNGTNPDENLNHIIHSHLTFAERIVVSVLTIVITSCGFIGNTVVILCILLSHRLRTVCNIFVLNLCIADLLTCLTGPFMVLAFLSSDEWKRPAVICSGVAFINVTCIGCSVYTLTTISISRLILISSTRGLYVSIYSSLKLGLAVFLTWFVPLIMACLPPVFGIGRFGYDKRFHSCTWDPSHPLSHAYSLILGIVFYPVPLLIILVCYSLIFAKIRKHSRAVAHSVGRHIALSKTDNGGEAPAVDTVSCTEGPCQPGLSQRQVEVTRNMFLVVVVFVVCLTPYGVSLLITNSGNYIVYAGMFLIGNSCINPIIYSLKHPDFKIMIKSIIKCECLDVE